MRHMWTFFFGFFSLFSFSSLFAEEVEMPSPNQGWQMIVILAIFFLFFYLILWRPEQKRRKLLEQQRNQLKKGDRVTAMGILGTVVRVDQETVILKMYDGAKIEFVKAAVSDIMPSKEGEQDKEED